MPCSSNIFLYIFYVVFKKYILKINNRTVRRELNCSKKLICNRHLCHKDLYDFPHFFLDVCIFITPVLCIVVLTFLRNGFDSASLKLSWMAVCFFKSALDIRFSWKCEAFGLECKVWINWIYFSALTDVLCQQGSIHTVNVNTFQNLSVLYKIHRIVCEPHIWKIDSLIR